MKPLCAICLDRHEAHQAHRFSSVAPVANAAPVVDNSVANKKSKYRDPEARRKYMRELMRKRRQKV